jgi:hypothetical protein
MSSQPIDEDGFHSIAWDDAPPRTNSRPILTEISGSDDGEGFETISPGSPVASASGSTAHDQDTLTERQYRDRGEHDTDKQQSVDFNGKWMSIEVRDPVKEHEGSKDMYVSYAVRTKVCTFHKMVGWRIDGTDESAELSCGDVGRSSTIPRLCVREGTSGKEFPSLCSTSYSGEAPLG